jgi:hypothetical protein
MQQKIYVIMLLLLPKPFQQVRFLPGTVVHRKKSKKNYGASSDNKREREIDGY